MLNKLASLFAGSATSPKLPPNWHGFLPPGIIAYAFGDIHGYDDAQKALHDQVSEHQAQNPGHKFYEFNLADFTDRGPHTKEVLDQQVARDERNRVAGIKTLYLQADHEFLFLSILSDKVKLDWISKGFFDNGGLETLASYGVNARISSKPRDSSAHQIHGTDMFVHDAELVKMKADLWNGKIPLSHVKLLEKAVPMLHLGSYTFVHAAVDPAKPIRTKDQDIKVLTGISSKSREFAKYTGDIPGDRVIVRAHSISDKPVLTHNQIGIDTGIFKPGGKLTCAILQGSSVNFIQAETSHEPYDVEATIKRAKEVSDAMGPASAFTSLT